MKRDDCMIPLSMTQAGEKALVFRVNGSADMKQHLSDLGFVSGTEVEIISQRQGDVIVKIKDSRLALTKKMAEKVLVQI